MPTNLGVSEVVDKHGVTADIEAKRFDGTRTVQIQGDVTASQTWNGDSSSPLTLNASIGAKKVTTDKINDKAVQAQQIDDGAVGLTQIATNAMNGTVQDNDSKLATHASVKTYVDSQISGQGTYLGKHTVAEINAMQTADLHNGDRVMISDSGTINLGPGGVGFDVEAGEDLILYKSGSTVQWDSMDGNFKTKQTAVDDPTASGTGLTFIDSISQDENGEITPSKKTVQDGTTSQKGVVQLEDSISSTSTTKAATPNSVKSAYDLANTANTGAVKNVAYDSTNKKITKTINGQTTDVVSAATLKTDMSLNNVDNTSDANKPVSTAQQNALDLKLDKTGDGKDVTVSFSEASTRANIGTGEKLSVMFGKIKKWFTDLKALAFKDTVSDSDISGTISDNHIASASTWNGKVTGPSSATADDIAVFDGATGKLVKDSGVAVLPSTSTWDGTSDAKVPTAKAVQARLDGKQDGLPTTGTPSETYAINVSGSAESIKQYEYIQTSGKAKWYELFDLHNGSFRMYGGVSFVISVRQSRGQNYVALAYVQKGEYQQGEHVTARCSVLTGRAALTSEHDTILYYKVTENSGYKVYLKVESNIPVVIDSFLMGFSNGQKITPTLLDSEPSDVTEFEFDNILHTNNVASIYSSTGTNPVNGTAVAAALATSLTDVAYVANQSGGGGNLNKTKNGTTTSVLAFMNDSEAVAIWADAKTAAANAS